MATLTGFLQDNEGSYIDKDTEAILDYTVDWINWLPTGETISASSWSVEAITGDLDPLTSTGPTFTSTKAIVTLRNGTAGKIYKVYNQITTNSGKVDRRYFRVKVKTRTV